jgi:hypothetical protein
LFLLVLCLLGGARRAPPQKPEKSTVERLKRTDAYRFLKMTGALYLYLPLFMFFYN